MGRVNFKEVAFVAAGVFLGDKLSGILTDKVMTYIGGVTGTSDTTRGFVKLAVGIIGAGLIWRYQPAFGLGVAVGATNALLNQYVFAPLWGIQAGYTGIQGLGDYQNRPWKVDNWLQAPGAAVAGLGNPNPLLKRSL